jgi:hypothetical protein
VSGAASEDCPDHADQGDDDSTPNPKEPVVDALEALLELSA